MTSSFRLARLHRDNLIALLLSVVLVITGYVYLRYAYRVTDELPFAQEIVLVVLGTILTVLITAVLLNKQTEVELRKEQSIKFVELKAETYLGLLGYLEDVLSRGTMTHVDFVRLQFLTHRLALFASPEVLFQYHSLVCALRKAVEDDHVLQPGEADRLQRELARLSASIRRDLVGEFDDQSGYAPEQILAQIIENTDEAIEIQD